MFPATVTFCFQILWRRYFTKPTIFPKVYKLINVSSPSKPFSISQMSVLGINLLFMHLDFIKAACLVCASSALPGAGYVAFSLTGQVSRALSLSPNPVSHRGTSAGHGRRLWSLHSLALARILDGGSCFIRMAQHWLLLSSFVFLGGIYLQPVMVKPAALSAGFKLAS